MLVSAVRTRRICVSSTPARLGLGTCHCERYISSSGLRPDGTSDDATMQSVTTSHEVTDYEIDDRHETSIWFYFVVYN